MCHFQCRRMTCNRGGHLGRHLEFHSYSSSLERASTRKLMLTVTVTPPRRSSNLPLAVGPPEVIRGREISPGAGPEFSGGVKNPRGAGSAEPVSVGAAARRSDSVRACAVGDTMTESRRDRLCLSRRPRPPVPLAVTALARRLLSLHRSLL